MTTPDSMPSDELSERIIGCAYEVGRVLGSGFLEKVYENALAHQLRKSGLSAERQYRLQVKFDGVVVGDYMADLLVEGCILVELKAAREIDKVHIAQCINYLKTTGLRLCLLINFGGTKVQVRRIVY